MSRDKNRVIIMAWEPRSYGKLLKEFDRKVTILNYKRLESDGHRHELYNKRDNGTKLTPAENEEIEERCDYEHEISDNMSHLNKLLKNVDESMDRLKEELDKCDNTI